MLCVWPTWIWCSDCELLLPAFFSLFSRNNCIRIQLPQKWKKLNTKFHLRIQQMCIWYVCVIRLYIKYPPFLSVFAIRLLVATVSLLPPPTSIFMCKIYFMYKCLTLRFICQPEKNITKYKDIFCFLFIYLFSKIFIARTTAWLCILCVPWKSCFSVVCEFVILMVCRTFSTWYMFSSCIHRFSKNTNSSVQFKFLFTIHFVLFWVSFV